MGNGQGSLSGEDDLVSTEKVLTKPSPIAASSSAPTFASTPKRRAAPLTRTPSQRDIDKSHLKPGTDASSSSRSSTEINLNAGTRAKSSSGDRSGIYIPPPLRNRQKCMPTSADLPAKVPVKPIEKKEHLAKNPAPPVVLPCVQWTPWQSIDFLSDLLRLGPPEGQLDHVIGSRSPPPPIHRCQIKVSKQLQLHELLMSIPEEQSREEQPEIEIPSRNETPPAFETPPPFVSLQTPTTPTTPATYSTVVKCTALTNATETRVSVPIVNTSTFAKKSVPKVKVEVTPMRTVNFTDVPIQFTVKVENAPLYCALDTFEAIAVTPSGSRQLQCQIRRGSTREQFQGCFMATAEVGHYTLKVTVQLRNYFLLRKSSRFKQTLDCGDDGRFSDKINILVSRNYYRESLKAPSKTFKLDILQPTVYRSGGTGIVNAWGMACEKRTNRIYYTESADNYICCVDSTGKVIFRINQGPGGRLLTGAPTGICCDEYHRRLIVCERGNHRVSFFSLDTGEYITSFGTFGKQNGMFNCPWDVDVSPRGCHIAVTDIKNERIQLFDRNGNYLRQFHLRNPRGICFDASDGHQIYVTDWEAGGVTEIPVGFQTFRKLNPKDGRLLQSPQGLIADQVGGLLVADAKNKYIRNLTALDDDEPLLSTISRVGDHSLKDPVNVALMQDGKVVLLEGSGKVHIF